MVERKWLFRRATRTISAGFLLIFLLSSFSHSSQELVLENIIEKAGEKLFAGGWGGRWEALAVSTRTDTDRNWKPVRILQVTRRIKFDDGQVEEEILQAVQIEKGRARDITEDYRRERLEARKKIEGQREKDQDSDRPGRPKNSMNLEELIPFSQKNKNKFDFYLKGRTEVNGEKCYLLEARAKEKKDFLLEGLFYLSQNSFELRRMELTPASKPGVLKEFLMRIDFETREDRLFIKKTWIKIHGSFLIKSVRRIVEEEYREYRMLESGPER